MVLKYIFGVYLDCANSLITHLRNKFVVCTFSSTLSLSLFFPILSIEKIYIYIYFLVARFAALIINFRFLVAFVDEEFLALIDFFFPPMQLTMIMDSVSL